MYDELCRRYNYRNIWSPNDFGPQPGTINGYDDTLHRDVTLHTLHDIINFICCKYLDSLLLRLVIIMRVISLIIIHDSILSKFNFS